VWQHFVAICASRHFCPGDDTSRLDLGSNQEEQGTRLGNSEQTYQKTDNRQSEDIRITLQVEIFAAWDCLEEGEWS
jgi:hypothetical protein